MTLLTHIMETARTLGKGASPLYNLHPEIAQRQPILREYSDERAAPGNNAYTSVTAFYTVHPWVHKAVSVIANNFAPLPMRYVRGVGDELKVITSGPIAKLLENPNPEQSPEDLRREWVIMMMLAGEIGLEAVPSVSGSNLLELWPREPQHITIKPGALGSRYRTVEAYVINDRQGPEYRLTPEQLIHFKFTNPLSVWRGLAPITAIRNSILLDTFAQAWSRLFFKNSARPDFALITPEGTTKTEREEILKQLESDHIGEPHKPIVLENGVTDIKTLSFPPKDIEWLQQQEKSRDEIGAIFGVPDEIMGYGRDTYENFATAERVLWTLTIVPLAGLFDGVFTRFLRKVKAIAPDERIETDFSNISALQEDMTGKVGNANTLFGMGVPFNTAKRSVRLAMPDVPGGDVGYLPFGLTPVSRPAGGKSRRAMKGFGARRFSKAPTYGSAEHKAAWEHKDSRLDDHRKRMMRKLEDEFSRQQREAVGKLRRAGKSLAPHTNGHSGVVVKAITIVKADADDVFDPAAEAAKFRAAFEKLFIAALVTAGQDELDGLGVDETFDSDGDEADSLIQDILDEFAQKVNDTTYSELGAVFEQIEADGLSLAQQIERLNEYFAGRKDELSLERISRTTMTGINGAGDVSAWAQSGVVTEREWLATLDNRVRDDHKDAHGQRVSLADPFDVGGEFLAFPGDPQASPEQIVNCRCTQVAVVEG